MDFHSLSRRELQSLCKLNKIPANITNIAMADALHSLEIVEGIEEFLKVSQSETADLVEKVEVFSPKALTSIRPRVKTTETASVTRTTRRGSKHIPTEVEEPKNDLLKTPACKKAPGTSSRRNVNYQLNECEKEEGLVENRYSTRRSTRLTEKKSAVPRVRKGTENAVKIDSILDATSEEPVEVSEETEVEDICNAFEKLDVLVLKEEPTHKSEEEDKVCDEDADLADNVKNSDVTIDQEYAVKPESDGISGPSEVKSGEEDVDCDQVSNLKQESHETLNSCEDNFNTSGVKNDLKPESNDILSPCEDQNSVQKLDVGDDFVKENVDVMVEEHEDFNLGEETFDAVKENSFGMVQEENSDSQLANNASLESGAADAELGHEDTLCEDSEMNNQVPETNVSSTMVSSDETKMTKEAEDVKPAPFTDVKKDSALRDDKENIVIKKEKDEMKSLNEISIRQLKKQLKALTLKSLNSKEGDTTTRPALQALCDNQMVVGAETHNKM